MSLLRCHCATPLCYCFDSRNDLDNSGYTVSKLNAALFCKHVNVSQRIPRLAAVLVLFDRLDAMSLA